MLWLTELPETIYSTSMLSFSNQEFGVERISDLVKVYDLLIQRVVGNIVRAVDIVVGLFNGDTSINKLFDNFVEELENIPSRISVSALKNFCRK